MPPHYNLSRFPKMGPFVLYSGEKPVICFVFESRQLQYNKLLTSLASSSRNGEHWPSVVFVRTRSDERRDRTRSVFRRFSQYNAQKKRPRKDRETTWSDLVVRRTYRSSDPVYSKPTEGQYSEEPPSRTVSK